MAHAQKGKSKSNKSCNRNKNRQPSADKFTGKCPDLKGYVFDYQPGKNMADACVRTVTPLANK